LNQREIEQALREEVAEWPGVELEIGAGGKHPKAKLTFEGKTLFRAFGGNQSHAVYPHKMIRDMRLVMIQLGAKRSAPEPSEEDIEKRYRKRNEEGVRARPDPIDHEKAEPKPSIADQLVEAGAATEEQAQAARSAVQAEGSAATYAKRAQVDEALERSRAIATVEATTPKAERMLELLTQCGIAIDLGEYASCAEIIARAADLIEDGIYFDLPAEVYHAVPALGSGSIAKLIVSPGTFWRGSWLDPDRPELDEDATKAQVLGKAYHTARLEPEKFHELFVRELDKGDFPQQGFLSSDTAVKAELKGRGLTQSIGTETIEERAERLVESGYEGTIWPLEKARWEKEVAGRTPIPASFWDDIERDMERLRGNQEIADKLEGGEPEVSIFWTDEHGLRCKARFDYLRPDLWDDFKTFDNSRGKVLAQAISDAFRFNRYYVQAVHYRDAAEAIRVGGLQLKGKPTDGQRALIAAIQIRPEELECWYIMQEKNGVPNLLARRFEFSAVPIGRSEEADAFAVDEEHAAKAKAAQMRKTGIHQLGRAEIEKAKRDFYLYSQVYRPGQPWAPIEPCGTIGDLDFNSFWLEGRG
jgi:hypothetical protein